MLSVGSVPQLLTRVWLPLVAAHPNWAVAAVALGGIAVGLTLLIWSARRIGEQPLGAGCVLLVGSVLTPLSVLTLVWAMDLADTMGR